MVTKYVFFLLKIYILFTALSSCSLAASFAGTCSFWNIISISYSSECCPVFSLFLYKFQEILSRKIDFLESYWFQLYSNLKSLRKYELIQLEGIYLFGYLIIITFINQYYLNYIARSRPS